MVTRRIAKEKAVNEDDELGLPMYYDDEDVASVATFLEVNDNVDGPEWAAAYALPSSSPFVVEPLEDYDMEEDIIMTNIQVAFQPLQPEDHHEQPIQPAHSVQPLHPAQPMITPPAANDAITDIVAPETPPEKKEMVRRFRDEVWRYETEE